MKVTRVLLVLAFAIASLLIPAVMVSAEGETWVSGIMIQNQNPDKEANITVTFYWAEGTALAGQVACSFDDVIPAGQAKAYYIPTDPKTVDCLPADFVGSAVVSSDQPVAANLNTQVPSGTGNNTPDIPNRMGTASGVLEPATTLYFTQLMKNYSGWNSYIAVQNTGAEVANVTVTYYNDADGSVAGTDQVTIQPYSTYIFEQADNESLPASLWSGSAKVVSTNGQPLAGIANLFNSGVSKDKAQFQSYNGVASGGTLLYVPRIVKDLYDYQGGMKIQNVGDAATDVTITFFYLGAEYVVNVGTLAPGQAKGLYIPDVPELADLHYASFSAIIESTGEPIIATVNEDNRLGIQLPGQEGRGTTYNAIADGSQTDTVLFPQFTNKFYGFASGVQVQNVGNDVAHVVAVFSQSGRADVEVTYDLQPMESISWFGPDVPGLTPDFNGSVVITADQPLVGIANMSSRTDKDTRFPTNYGDSYVTYNGINK